MAAPPKLLFWFLLISIILWIAFIFASRLVAWFLSRILGASVGFRVGGWRCLRDVVVKFKKGAVESISISEIRLSLRQSLINLGVGFFSRAPKLQLVICDIEVTVRSSHKSTKKVRSQKARNPGRGKWMIVANMARFLSVSATDLIVKTPRATVEFKELKVDITKDGGSRPTLFVQINILPIAVYFGVPRASCDQPSSCNQGLGDIAGPASVSMEERFSAPLCCEALALSCELVHNREVGVVIKNFDITSGKVALNLNEELFLENKTTADVFPHSDNPKIATSDAATVANLSKKHSLSSVTKYFSLFPEKVCFNLPKLDVSFIRGGQNLCVENEITGIQLKGIKSRSNEDVGENTRLDIQMEFSEIHLLREVGSSILEILKVDVISSVYVPTQLEAPVRAEIDIKLGGTQCNIIIGRLRPWIELHFSRKKRMVLREGNSSLKKSPSSDFKLTMWTCTVSAPEMTLVFYSFSGLPLYHVCSQSSHLFANNISSSGAALHMELGELNMHMADEYEECVKESLFGVETNLNSLVHVAKFSLDRAKKDMESSEEHRPKSELVFSVDVTGMGIYLTFKRLESLIATAISLQALLKKLSPGKRTVSNRVGHSSETSGKGAPLLKFNLERCSVNLSGQTGLENTIITDPKRVNYGSQGGRLIICNLADGTTRSAAIMPTISDEMKKLKYVVSLDIYHFSVCTNKEKNSTQMELERARSIYQEYLEEQRPITKLVLFDMQNAKFVRRSGGLKEIAVCSYFSATDITVRWEPDVHLSIYELLLHLKLLLHNQKVQEINIGHMGDASGTIDIEKMREAAAQSEHDKKHRKMESVFAIDVEILTIYAAVGDGVNGKMQIQSIFSENARIGVLLEGLMLSFNDSRVFKSSRMQLSRIPSSSTSDAKMLASMVWDWVIQGLDVHICMPFRLQLRAIEDAIEDMLRSLKLVCAAKKKLIFPTKTENSNPRKPSSMKFGCLKLCIRKVTADIEEEPIQGWLDEHYHLMKTEACELAVRLKYLEELISKGPKSSGSTELNPSRERKFCCYGFEVDMKDPSSIRRLQDEIYKESFRSYYKACQNLVPSEGSGACKQGFQAGFKPSAARTSLLSISATDLDINLTRIEGGDSGMIEVLKKLDPICQEKSIPFSRLLGRNVLLQTGSLAVHLRNYAFPLFYGISGRCEGCVVLAQQATCFQPQIQQDVFIGKWRKVSMLRSASGTTPPMKTYLDLPIYFQKADVSFGVGYEPSFADVSYAFTVALRRANLSVKDSTSNTTNSNSSNLVQMGKSNTATQPPKKERSLPWWDDVRYYIHGHVTLIFSETKWNVLATTDPYEKLDKLEVLSNYMEIQQSSGRVYVSAENFKICLSSLESLVKNRSLKLPNRVSSAFLEAPAFSLEVTMDWGCDSGNPLNHYLHALPNEGKSRQKVYDPFRSTSLSLRWNFLLRPSLHSCEKLFPSSAVRGCSTAHEIVDHPPCRSEATVDSPTMHVGAHDLAWIFKFWNMNYLPPHKLRSFSRWPRFKIPRVARSGNLSLDKVMTEFMLRLDAAPSCIRHVPLHDDDPAKGLTFKIAKLKYELCYSRGKQKYSFECKRDPLDLVYQGLDLHVPKAYLYRGNCANSAEIVQLKGKCLQSGLVDRVANENFNCSSDYSEKLRDDGFLLSSDYFTIRRQAPKADPSRLLAWQEAGRRNLEMTYVRSEFENGSDSDEQTRSDPSDDDGFNVVIADNCQRVFVYGLKLLWTIENRDAIWSWVGGISKAFEAPKPSPSRQYAQRKLLENNQVPNGAETVQDNISKVVSAGDGACSSQQQVEDLESSASPSHSIKMENSSSVAIAEKDGHLVDSEEEGTRHFMVNVIEPQFNLHSDDANGRFLLAAASGRVLARSFHSVLHVGYEMIEQLGTGSMLIRESQPQMTWKRMEFSVMLEHVQAHVAPTDVDPGAGLQWLPKIQSSPKLKRTGALLERVFMPCDMYFRYTRHKGGTTDLKVKPLKELTFSSRDITATMTSRQFQVMLDVLSNLLFARLPKPRKSSLSYPAEDDEDVEEEADEMVPEGIEEVELARVNLEQKDRQLKVLLDDIRKLSVIDTSNVSEAEKESELWMTGDRSMLVQGLKKEFGNVQKCRKVASASLRMALQNAAQLRLMEKEKNKSPSYAMRISLQINKVVWGMLVDGKPFAEAEINDMIYDFERDYKDIGIARFTTKYFVVRNCLPNAKSDMLLSAWNPPPEWGKKFMLRVDAKQGAPKDGSSPLELFQVEIYPLKIHLTETMFKMMWDYFFPEEEQDSQRRQEVWKVSTTAGSKRVKKGSMIHETSSSSSHFSKESEVPSKSNGSLVPLTSGTNQPQVSSDSSHALKLQSSKTNNACGSTPELRRTSSFDKTWEENVAESVANELVLQVHSLSLSSSKSGPVGSIEQQDEPAKNKLKESKPIKSGPSSHEDKKVGKSHEEKRPGPRKMMEFHIIKISQVELLVTYEGSRFAVSDLRLLMDAFHHGEFTGTWRRLFSRVKKHIIWGVLKSVTGMQGKKFKDKAHTQTEHSAAVPDSDLHFSDSDGGQAGQPDPYPISWLKRPNDGAGDGFVTSIRGLFNSQRRKAKAFVLRTMRGEAENEYHGDWSESDVEFSPFARQLTITKAKKLIRRHTKKFRARGQKGSSHQRDSLPSSPRETTPFESDSSGSSPYEDFHE